jgi:tetratricopeptide (TPR) repeat protein
MKKRIRMRRWQPLFDAMRKNRRNCAACVQASAFTFMLVLNWNPAAAQDVDAAWKDLMVQGEHAALGLENSKAEQIYQNALREAERFGADDHRVVATLRSLGFAYHADHKVNEAEGAFRKAIAILDKGDVEENLDYANISLGLASVLTEEGSPSTALPLLRRSLAIVVKRQGGESPDAAAVHCALGDAYRALKSWPEAEISFKRCAAIREADGGVMTAVFGDAIYPLALVYEKEGKYALADSHFKLAEKIRERTLGIMSPAFADVLESHAGMLRSMGRDKEAAQKDTLAATIRRHQSKR